MGTNAQLEQLYSERSGIWERLRPVQDRRTREQNDLWNSIVLGELVPNMNRIRAIEFGLC